MQLGHQELALYPTKLLRGYLRKMIIMTEICSFSHKFLIEPLRSKVSQSIFKEEGIVPVYLISDPLNPVNWSSLEGSG